MNDKTSEVEFFWDVKYTEGHRARFGDTASLNFNDPVLLDAIKYFGNVDGKRVLDIGCGAGVTSLFFAHHGASVISIDSSSVAIDKLRKYCEMHEINNINAYCMGALDVGDLGPVDYVVGTMILHHIEPFSEFAKVLSRIVRPGGACIF